MIPLKPWKEVKKDFDDYHRFFVEANGYNAPPPLVGGFCYVDENADCAEEMGMKYIADCYRTAIRHYEFNNTRLQGLKGYEFYSGSLRYLAKRGEDGASEDFAKPMAWGTLEQVFEKLRRIHDLSGMAGIMTRFSFGNRPDDMAEQSLKLLVRDVMPELRKVPTEIPAFADAEGA